MSGQPSTNGWGFVDGVIVHHQMDIEIDRNIARDFAAFAKAREAFSDHLFCRNRLRRSACPGRTGRTGWARFELGPRVLMLDDALS